MPNGEINSACIGMAHLFRPGTGKVQNYNNMLKNY